MAATINSAFVDSGQWKIMYFPKKASTLLTKNCLVQFDGSGFVIEATTTAGASDTPLIGIHIGAIQAAADATTALVPIAVPNEPLATARLLIDTGTPSATADLGKSFDISATGGVTVSTTSNEPVTFVKYISATEGLFVLTNLSSPAA